MSIENLIKLNEFAEQVHNQGKRVAILLEGRDGAGKSGTIRELTRYLPPYTYKVLPSFMPTKRMMKAWLPEWKKLLPESGQIVFYDRSWYSRALLQPVMGWCSDRQYQNFMSKVIGWECSQDVSIMKIWLSVDEAKQRALLERRESDPLRYWKFSPNDAKTVSKFDDITIKKQSMFSTDNNWQIIDMSDKDQGRDNALVRVVDFLAKSMA